MRVIACSLAAILLGGFAALRNSPVLAQSSSTPQSASPAGASSAVAPRPQTPASTPSGANSAQANSPAETPPAKPQAATSSTPVTVLKVTTRLVLVDVVVTDHSGTPATNLKKEDFEVRENGKPQKIVAFAFQPPPSSLPAPQQIPKFEPGVYTNLRNINGEAGPPTILLVDALNTPFKDQLYLRQQLVKYLQNVEPRRNVAIYTLGTRLRLIQDFTGDPQLLRDALKKLAARSSMFNDQDSLADDFSGLDPDSTDQATALIAQNLTEFEAEQQTFQRDLQVRLTIDAMQELAQNVEGYPGRKNLVWLSGAFPLTVFPDETLQDPFHAASSYGEDLRRIAALFSANQIAVYPVDARGLIANLMPDASQNGSSMVGPRGGPNTVHSLQRASADLFASHDTMNELAGQTGGRAFYNRNDIDHAIALSMAEGSSYYTLAYYPEDKQMNGKFRKIEVSLDRKGLQTRYRKGYFASEGQSSDNKAARLEFGRALAPDTPLATALPFIARLNPPSKERKEVVVDFSVVPSSVLFQLQGELQHAQLDFVTCVYDAKGKAVGTPRTDVLTTQLHPATYAEVMKHGLRFRQTMTLPPGKYVLKFGVWDQQSNMIGTLVAKLEVPAAEAPGNTTETKPNPQ